MHNFNLSKLLKVLMVTALIILCVLVIWALVLYVVGLDFQWWAKALILICMGASVLVVVLLRKLFLKRREMKFVDGIIGADDMPGSVSSIGDASRELRRRFKHAISTLKKSHLKRKGNPLYVLPWYLIVGRSGSGKSTAIKSARLPSPFGDINRVAGIEGTRNCDWWFFDDSVVIDIAGRYSIHRNEDLDKKEWRTFLEHLVKYRKKEPLNGVIVTVEADQLLEDHPEKIENEGRILRKRVDEVTAVMGAKFPVYLLVTKSDLIYGINRYCQLLSEPSVSQAMGLMNQDGETDITAFVNKTIDTITEKLKDIRLLLANKDEVKGRHYIDPEVLLFPNEFERLRLGMNAFCNGAFKNNPFQELPFLRGIYFCSGRQEGRPVVSQAESLNQGSGTELPGTGNGFFLYDFFSKILPADRSLFTMTRTAKEWHRLTHNLWLTAFVTIVLAFCILLTYSWNENKAIINLVSPKFKKAIVFNNDPIDDITLMAEFSGQINAIEERNRNWKVPRLGLHASIELERILKKRYCQRYQDHFESGIYERIESRIANGGWAQNDYEPAIKYIPYAVRRINMIRARFDGADVERLESLPAPNFAMFHSHGIPTMEKEITDRYKRAFINYLVWQDNAEALNDSLVGLHRLLDNYFHENQGDLKWLVAWADKCTPDHAITLNQFWYSDSDDSHLASIHPAFTIEGRKQISHFVLNELEHAMEQPLWVVKPKEAFEAWYKEVYYSAWIDFAMNFSQAKTLFTDPQRWAMTIERFTSDESPYLGLLKTMDAQLVAGCDDRWPNINPVAESDQRLKRWLVQIKEFGIIRNAAASDALANNKAAEKLTRKVSHKTKVAAKLAMAGMKESKIVKGKQAYKHYHDALNSFDGISTSAGHAYVMAKEGFEDDPAVAKSAIFAAQKAVQKFKVALNPDEMRSLETEQNPFWKLITDPVDELWRYSVQQAGCHLQSLWDQEVLVKTDGIYNRHQLSSMLFGDKGFADSFISKYAGPFVRRSSRRGYHSRQIRGCSVPFQGRYFSFMKSGKRWSSASNGQGKNRVVTVVAYPTDVNIEARVKPHMTRLMLEGVDGSTVLENRQYPNEKKFDWSPSKSGDVTLQIMLGDIALKRKYTGYCAFGKFLREFRRGKRIFTVKDFPEHKHEFERLGVREIEVVYQFQAGQIAPVIRLLNATPGRPPATIVQCPQLG